MKNIQLTASEIGALWTNYETTTMEICVLAYFVAKANDDEIKPIIAYALELSRKHKERIEGYFRNENIPIPHGFTEVDVKIDAPPLYSDEFMVGYIENLSKSWVSANAIALTICSRRDIREYYTECLASSSELYNKAVEVMLSKGIYQRPPILPYPDQVEWIQKESYMNSWFGGQRPISTVEISHIHGSIQNNQIGIYLLTGFSQCVRDSKLHNYLLKGIEIGKKHIETFTNIFRDEDLPIPTGASMFVTKSTESPFSDRLIFNHVGQLSQISIADYGGALAVVMRKDIATTYTKLSVDVAGFAEEGSTLGIANKWVEKMPQAPNRKELAKA